MPEVKRNRPAGWDERRRYHTDTWYDYKQVAWRDMTRPEIAKAVGKRAGLLGVLSGLLLISLPNGPVDFWGDAPSVAKRSDQIEKVVERKDSLVNGLSFDQQFALMYLRPAQVTIDGNVGGNGIIGAIADSDGSNLAVNIGQNCLNGKAYDTGASYIDGLFTHGELSAVASLSVLDGVVRVHPAGSDAPALVFDVDAKGMLVADDATTQTLEQGYHCAVGLGMYEQTGSDSYKPLDLGVSQR